MKIISFFVLSCVMNMVYAHLGPRFGGVISSKPSMKQVVVSAILGSCLPLAVLQTEPAYAGAGDVLQAANREMTAKTDRFEGTLSRKFESLPEGSRKRRALAACKDKDMRAAAGFSSASRCTSAVVDGDYDMIAKAINGEVTRPVKRGRR